MAEAVVILGKPDTRAKALTWVKRAPDGTALIFRSPKRSLEQNAKFHACVSDVSRQVVWHGRKLTIDAWKDVFTAAYRSSKHSLEIVPGIDGGFVMLGMHTSAMRVEEMAELIELVLAFGAQNAVTFSEPTREAPAHPRQMEGVS